MAKVKQIKDPNDLEVHPTVATFEVALRNAEPSNGKKYYEIVLRSHDRSVERQLLLTDNKRLATRQIMAYHAGACAVQHIMGIPIER
jgi:hypothetical protein